MFFYTKNTIESYKMPLLQKLGGAISLIFMVLKLCEQIDWSWWLVFSFSIFNAVITSSIILMAVFKDLKDLFKEWYD